MNTSCIGISPQAAKQYRAHIHTIFQMQFAKMAQLFENLAHEIVVCCVCFGHVIETKNGDINLHLLKENSKLGMSFQQSSILYRKERDVLYHRKCRKNITWLIDLGAL